MVWVLVDILAPTLGIIQTVWALSVLLHMWHGPFFPKGATSNMSQATEKQPPHSLWAFWNVKPNFTVI